VTLGYISCTKGQDWLCSPLSFQFNGTGYSFHRR